MVLEGSWGQGKRVSSQENRAYCRCRSVTDNIAMSNAAIRRAIKDEIRRGQSGQTWAMSKFYNTPAEQSKAIDRQITVCKKVHMFKQRGGWIMIILHQALAGSLFTKSTNANFTRNLNTIMQYRMTVISRVRNLWKNHPPLLLKSSWPSIYVC